MSKQTTAAQILEEHDDVVGIVEYRKLIHDLRNGLAPILMQTQLLTQYAETPDTARVAIKKLAHAIEQSVKAMALLLEST